MEKIHLHENEIKLEGVIKKRIFNNICLNYSLILKKIFISNFLKFLFISKYKKYTGI